jgi:ribosomal protein S12 methylthiotransferase
VSANRTVALVTLGCARNEVDSEELAGRLAAVGWRLVDDARDADVAVVNTCGFVEQAKKDSIDTVLEAADLRDDAGARTRAVVAVGCLAERYGAELAESLPEADAVLGFDSYAELSAQLDAVLRGERPASHAPRDRRSLLPLTPVSRARAAAQVPGHGSSAAGQAPGHGSSAAGQAPGQGSGIRPSYPGSDLELPAPTGPAAGPRIVRKRLDQRPWAPLKLASGCDRRCAFCAIPAFRGAFVSRPAEDVLAEAAWLGERGVKELLLVSENSTSYGKDLGDLRALESLLPRLTQVCGIERVRVSYLQPAELRPSLLEVIAGTPGVVPYFDLSFQHASPAVLRRMRRFGGTTDFLKLVGRIRELAPTAGIRSNVIVGFPGETDRDLGELEDFLVDAKLDVVGVFGFSPEDGTEAAGMPDALDPDTVMRRTARVMDLVEELAAQRAEDRLGETVEVLVEEIESDDEPGRPPVVGRAAHQGPDVDGVTRILVTDGSSPAVGDLVRAFVYDCDGPDLIARTVVPA